MLGNDKGSSRRESSGDKRKHKTYDKQRESMEEGTGKRETVREKEMGMQGREMLNCCCMVGLKRHFAQQARAARKHFNHNCRSK